MDSLARVLYPDTHATDIHDKAVVTAVSFDSSHRLHLAHNNQTAVIAQSTHQRLTELGQVLRGEVHLNDTSLNDNTISPGRIRRDVQKLAASFKGRDGAVAMGEHLRANFANGQHGISYMDHTKLLKRGTLHAEAALISVPDLTHIGVSKLSCRNCFQLYDSLGMGDKIRGGHGMAFGKWAHPLENNRIYNPTFVDNIQSPSFASDSDSNPENARRHRPIARPKNTDQSSQPAASGGGAPGKGPRTS